MSLFRQLFQNGCDQPQYDAYQWVKLWLGFYLNNAVLPVCMLLTYMQPHIQWAGATYIKKNGFVHRTS